MDPISLLVIVIGFLGRPLAEAVRDRYVDDLVRQLPNVAGPLADRARQLLAGTVAGDSEARRQLETELVAHREAAAALADAVQAQTGEPIPSVEASPVASQGRRDARMILLDGYQQALYNLTLAAVFAGRPVVVDAALQGPALLTACIPLFGDGHNEIRREAFPDPEHIWYSYSPEGVERGFGQDDVRELWPVTYHVRWIPDPEERERELVEREEQFQYEPDSQLPRSDLNVPFKQRWLRIMRVRPRWVQLESFNTDFAIPKSELDDILDGMEEKYGRKRITRSRESLSLGDYPEEWKPLLNIPKPNEGIELLLDATDRLVAREDQVRIKIQGRLAGRPLEDGTTEFGS